MINNSKGVALVSDYKKKPFNLKIPKMKKKKKIIIEDNFYDFKKGYFQYCIFWNIHWEITKLLINQPVNK